ELRKVPVDDRGDESTKPLRAAALNYNLDAQRLLEQHFGIEDRAVAAKLETADSLLQDANWQVARKPSPDGRFNGVDIPGALRDAQAAAQTLNTLVGKAAVAVPPTLAAPYSIGG